MLLCRSLSLCIRSRCTPPALAFRLTRLIKTIRTVMTRAVVYNEVGECE